MESTTSSPVTPAPPLLDRVRGAKLDGIDPGVAAAVVQRILPAGRQDATVARFSSFI